MGTPGNFGGNGRHGHLLDGRFKAKLVEGDDYLLALSRYVHLNSVRTGSMERKPIKEQIQALRAFRWNSNPGYIMILTPPRTNVKLPIC
jgi:hypothetical protein